ncbi:MAG: toxin-antitoxin system YwqK family antitoxin [Methyloprofundus sp.]|nr:toxin-antitoxin system YwqK family antitoxin [Methyloprofundus sp.]
MRIIPPRALMIFIVLLLPACSEGNNPVAELLVKYLEVLTLTSDDNEVAGKIETAEKLPTLIVETPPRIIFKAEKKNDILFAVNEDTPFTGSFVAHDHKNGQMSYEGKYKDGKQHGLSIWWHENGQRKSEQNYVNGKNHGSAIWWYENGQKKEETNYKDEKRHGLSRRWNEDGQKIREGNYVNGKEHGILITIDYENGKKESEIKTNYKNGIETTRIYIDWHENGQKESEFNYKNGKLHGLYTSWYKNGQKESVSYYVNGIEVDERKERWAEDGDRTHPSPYSIPADQWHKYDFSR